MLTDRDVVVKVLGKNLDPQQTKAGELAQGEAVTIGADDGADEIFATMARHKVRRLPVIDGHRLVGMVALADVARALPDPQVGDLLEALHRLTPPHQHAPARHPFPPRAAPLSVIVQCHRPAGAWCGAGVRWAGQRASSPPAGSRHRRPTRPIGRSASRTAAERSELKG